MQTKIEIFHELAEDHHNLFYRYSASYYRFELLMNTIGSDDPDGCQSLNDERFIELAENWFWRDCLAIQSRQAFFKQALLPWHRGVDVLYIRLQMD